MLTVSALRLQQQPMMGAPTPPPKQGPIEKIVGLLTEMQKGLHEQGKTDEEVYQKMDCWCTTNEAEKTASVAQAESDIKEAEATIENNAALSSKLKTEIEQLRAEVKQEEEAIATATEMRSKENLEFVEEEKNAVSTIESLSQAVKVLGKQNGAEGEEAATAALAAVKSVLTKQKDQDQFDAFIQQPTGAKSYNSRSGEIFGMLVSMKDSFEADLKESREQEARAQKAFEELNAAKKKQIAAAKDRTVNAITEMTESNVALATAKHDLKDANKRLKADSQFLVDLKEQCAKQDKEYEQRNAARAEEIEGVGDALNILTDDASRDLMGSTLGFVQVSVSEQQQRSTIVDLLQQAASTVTGTKRAGAFALLSISARLDGFEAIHKKIDEMLVALKQEQEDERTHRTWCKDEFRKNDVEKKDQDWKEEDLTKANNKLGDTIESLDTELALLVNEIAEAKTQIKRASEDREAANKIFQQEVSDARATETILTKVLERLQAVYAPGALKEKEKERALEAQEEAMANGPMTPAAQLTADAGFLQEDDDQPAFEPQKKQSSGGVLGLIQMAINDAKRGAAEAVNAEQQAQTAYEKFLKDTSDQLAADLLSQNDKSEVKGNAEVEKQQVESDLKATAAQLLSLSAYRSQVHAACDFVVNNFQIRQDARQSEMDSITDAKAILSGA